MHVHEQNPVIIKFDKNKYCESDPGWKKYAEF